MQLVLQLLEGRTGVAEGGDAGAGGDWNQLSDQCLGRGDGIRAADARL